MNAHVQSLERREILNVARRYRRDGYKVSGPDKWPWRPSFLGDAVPGLIAERDDDKVIVEVKRATNVPGSNDIIELAERVSAQPGWRFELIAIPAMNRIAIPDLVLVGDDVRRLLDKGFLKAAFIIAYATIENLIACLALHNNRNPASSTFPALLRDLVVLGLLDEETRHRINDAQARRSMIMHTEAEPTPTKSEVETLMSLCNELRSQLKLGSEQE